MGEVVIVSGNGRKNAGPETLPLDRPLGVERIAGGIVPPATGGRGGPGNRDAVLGGVYRPDGTQVDLSVLKKATRHVTTYPYDAATVRDADIVTDDREVVYCGYIQRHFGHVLVEVTSRLWWALREGFGGPLVFQSISPGILDVSYIRALFELIGIADRVTIAERWTRYASVVVPEASHRFNAHIAPEFLLPFERARAAALKVAPGSGPEKLYLSRSRLDAGRIIGEEAVEEMFAAEGYDIIHPQELGLAEQVALFARARKVAGFNGSAMHGLVFSPGGVEATHIARDDHVGRSFFLIDQLLGNDARYIVGEFAPRLGTLGRHEPFLVDIDGVGDMLRSEGVISPDTRPSVEQKALTAEFQAECALQLASSRRSPVRGLKRLSPLLGALSRRPFNGRLWAALPGVVARSVKELF
ncbi:hypothetical protein GGD81_000859 [Rhodobium orientis]|uniref:Glycosyltransferase 61 catalytic domain-containing protein n=1 Tax=Rhodobium orientis TaxID=34017 RepID=A0A327JHN0_9HYPH|nr:glycosyltransferase 61 family protein [Rhodobium orientis]MBB4301842.1 hypothetical protein [Rhodobium orientis]MBK5948383.1 hypothetical protein [Rhodobium orientis]RAI25216.1 hypothetical protein CH339_19265 [Rhodobium orientis]